MLGKHKLFDQTLWISTILCCAFAIFSACIACIFSLLNVFLTPSRVMHGPISLYLWNTIAGIFHLSAITLFSLEFHLFIKRNVLTKEEQESGWTSVGRTSLSWSFFLLIASVFFVVANILLIYAATRFRRPLTESKNETDSNLISADLDANILHAYGINDYQQMTDAKTVSEPTARLNKNGNFRSSSKLRRIIDLIY